MLRHGGSTAAGRGGSAGWLLAVAPVTATTKSIGLAVKRLVRISFYVSINPLLWLGTSEVLRQLAVGIGSSISKNNNCRWLWKIWTLLRRSMSILQWLIEAFGQFHDYLMDLVCVPECIECIDEMRVDEEGDIKSNDHGDTVTSF